MGIKGYTGIYLRTITPEIAILYTIFFSCIDYTPVTNKLPSLCRIITNLFFNK